MNPIIYNYKDNQTFDEDISKTLNTQGENVDMRAQIMLWDSNVSSMKLNIEHLKDYNRSNIIIRAVLKDSAKLNIFGNLHIDKEANNCDAYFEAKVLILGDKARATVLPELKIDNKNVKARHAVVIKRISDKDLYFLTSRGITLSEAQKMITEGFLNI